MIGAAPVPRRLYVHDDLSEELQAHGRASRVWALGQALLARLRQDAGRVVVLALAEQLDALVARGTHAPFAAAIGIGATGARVAAAVHARTGWFPSIERVDVWREEDGRGGYALAGTAPLAAQVRRVAATPSLAVVDDTLFSGLTMRGVLQALPPATGRRTHAFCLRAVGESLREVRRLAPVTAGFVAHGRLLEDVSFINLSGLVRRGAIRRTGGRALAFFERPEWMTAWFPGYDDEVIELCRALHAALDAAERAERR